MYNIKGLKQTNLELYNFMNNKPILSSITIKGEPFCLKYKKGNKIKYGNHNYSVTNIKQRKDHSATYFLKKED